MDGLIKAGADRAAHYKQELMEVAQPTLEHVKETLHDTVETVKSSVGMKSDDAAETDGVPAVLSAEEAVRKDDELTVVKDASSLTGLRQRSKAAGGNAGGSEISQQEEAEIERAKRQNVLVEKIIWGHGLSAKNDEWQRQQREREAGGAQPAATQSTLSELEAAAANAQQSAAPAGVTATSASTTTTASVSSSSFSSSSAFAAGSAPVTVSAPVMPSASLSVQPDGGAARCLPCGSGSAGQPEDQAAAAAAVHCHSGQGAAAGLALHPQRRAVIQRRPAEGAVNGRRGRRKGSCCCCCGCHR